MAALQARPGAAQTRRQARRRALPVPALVLLSALNLAHIAHCAHVLDGYQIAVEFRNRTWFDDKHPREVLAFEREHGLTHVVVDEPQGFTSSIPAVWEVTSSTLAIFRLHGRNAATWEKKGLASSSERFDYEYQKPELREFIAPVRQLAEQAEHVHVVFNNNLRDQGIRGATIFSSLLGLERGLPHTEG